MNYLSTKEIAKNWGVSRKTVNRYAAEGRIKDAYMVGNVWMIPEGTKKEDCKDVILPFTFPIYLYNDFFRIRERLKKEDEFELYDAQSLYNDCKLEESYEAHKALLEKTDDIYIRIACLYMLCIITVPLGIFQDHLYYQMLLSESFASDFPYKKEMQLLLYEAKAYYEGNEDLLNNTPDYSYAYSDQVFPLLIVEDAYRCLVQALSNPQKTSTNLLELACQQLKQQECYILLIRTHLFLASIYQIQKEYDKARHHVIEAFHIGTGHNILYNFSLVYSWSPLSIDKMLASEGLSMPQEIKEYSLRDQIHRSRLLEQLSKSNMAFALYQNDATLISLVANGHTNPEIADILGLSLSGVAKRLSRLYQKFGVNGKDELVEALLKVINKY